MVADQRWIVDWMIDALVHDLHGDGERRARNSSLDRISRPIHLVCQGMKKGPEGPVLTDCRRLKRYRNDVVGR